MIYTTAEYRDDNWDAGSWRWKNRRQDEDADRPKTELDGNEIVSAIAPGPQDIVVRKKKPSGFFGTDLASYLTLLGCDSVVIIGTTTSGCVRATAVDAFSLNYRVVLGRGSLFRSQRGQPCHQPVRHAREICRCHEGRGTSWPISTRSRRDSSICRPVERPPSEPHG